MNVMFLCKYSLFSIGDNIIDKFIQLAFIRYKHPNAAAHGCRDFVTRAAIPYIMIDNFFLNRYPFSKGKGKT